jgi:AcrR family transcriptional regulator
MKKDDARKHMRLDQKQDTRRGLITAAQSLFAEQGFTATKTLDIARRAGVSHGAVFAHFPTREKLVAAAIEAFGEKVGRRLHALASHGKSMKEVLSAHLKGIREYELFYSQLIMEEAVLPPEARQTLMAIQSALSFHLYAAAQREINAGRMRPIPMHLLFNTWVGLLHYYLNHRALFAPAGSVIDEKGEELLNHFTGLMAAGKGKG